MAVTEIHPIRTTLAKAIAYITNPEKTENGLLTSSYVCSLDPQKSEEEFLDIRSLGSGRGDVLAQHIYQSFDGQEVTPEQAMKIGQELADKLLGGKYQYIIATHVDKKNIHNHIIFNNVSFTNYKTFEYMENRGKNSWKKLRNFSDEICREHGISVIENPNMNGKKCYYEWQQDQMGKSWKSKLRRVIDETIMESHNFDDFLEKIRAKKIECVYTPQNVIKIKFRMPGQEKFARGRTIGWYYDEPQIKKRIEQYQLLNTGVSGRDIHTKIIDTSRDVFQASKGLLNWAEIQNMKEASRLINFLSTHQIQSQNEFENKAVITYNERMAIVAKLNGLQSKIDDVFDCIRNIRKYKKYKPVYDEYRKSGGSPKYKKEHASAIENYENVVKELTEIYPDKKLPKLETLERQRAELMEQRKTLNEEYKRIVGELKEFEFARESLEQYFKNNDRSRNKGLLE